VSTRSTILASACAAALCAFAGPAFATDFSGVLSGDYGHSSTSGASEDTWGASGAGAFGFGSNFAGQVNGGFHQDDIDVKGFGTIDLDDWNVDGSVFWRGSQGRAGAAVGYDALSGSLGPFSARLDATNYGGFGEWFAGQMFTLGLKGGGVSATANISSIGKGNVDGDYLGAAATVYAMPDLAFTGGYDYDHLSHLGNLNTWSINAEWLVSERTPVSIYAGYENSKVSGGGSNISTWTVGLKIYTDPMGPAPLVERQRTGAETWGTSFGIAGFAATF
jgi:hypothetical protein